MNDIVIPEPQHPPALARQSCVAPIVLTGNGVLSTIGFDDQSRFDASEINNVRWDRELSAETPAELISPQ
jgi:hypothetical protein